MIESLLTIVLGSIALRIVGLDKILAAFGESLAILVTHKPAKDNKKAPVEEKTVPKENNTFMGIEGIVTKE